MIKIEAVVIRDRVESVVEAVAAEAGHVGVTVVEAIGEGFQHNLSQNQPQALLIFIVPEHKAEKAVEAICGAARSGEESGDGLVWMSSAYNVRHNRTGKPLHEYVEARARAGVA